MVHPDTDPVPFQRLQIQRKALILILVDVDRRPGAVGAIHRSGVVFGRRCFRTQITIFKAVVQSLVGFIDALIERIAQLVPGFEYIPGLVEPLLQPLFRRFPHGVHFFIRRAPGAGFRQPFPHETPQGVHERVGIERPGTIDGFAGRRVAFICGRRCGGTGRWLQAFPIRGPVPGCVYESGFAAAVVVSTR